MRSRLSHHGQPRPPACHTAASVAAPGIRFDRLGDTRNAIRAFRAACRFEPSSAQHFYNLGIAYTRAGQRGFEGGEARWYGLAVQALAKALELDPNNAAAATQMAAAAALAPESSVRK